METSILQRVFVTSNDEQLPDPNPGMSPKEVKGFYSHQHPELASASIEGPEYKDGKAVYTFSEKVGTKG